MRKNVERRGMITFYVRKEFIPVWEKFLLLIKKDDRMKSLQNINKPEQIISVSILQLIFDYVQMREQELKENG